MLTPDQLSDIIAALCLAGTVLLIIVELPRIIRAAKDKE